MTIYQLTEQYDQLQQLAGAATDESEASMFADTLQALEGEIEAKIEACACVVNNLGHSAAGLREEEKRIAARRQAIENSITRIKTYMQDGMESASMERIKGKLFTVTLQLNPPRVVIDDDKAIPRDYGKTTWTPSVSQIADALKNDIEVPGAHLERTKGIRIR